MLQVSWDVWCSHEKMHDLFNNAWQLHEQYLIYWKKIISLQTALLWMKLYSISDWLYARPLKKKIPQDSCYSSPTWRGLNCCETPLFNTNPRHSSTRCMCSTKCKYATSKQYKSTKEMEQMIIHLFLYVKLLRARHLPSLSLCLSPDRYDPEFLVWNQSQAEQRMTK